ncbi:lipopolysaccharide biosynthesis protein [Hymenobacter cheonanensis]|uniref:lipopolysaccharide biosynthesis protein n=1 Tax=Hymenobacter sp. CA2-7 TaxID=3063993 RepID=UPI002713F8AB|nr:polysaccharide biosynthesis C-terminal domain-containing protein [Hymenobacter sp. CA2-7]MDO7887454.1 polysaccharide biosynthesis C-terminal domain-containing protein [Hymenobacter sp. CA2-7]
MLRRIIQHFAARLGGAVASLAVVWLTARYLGAAGRGEVSLFVTATAAILLFTGLLGGSSLIYLVPRRNVWHLLGPAYAWAGLVCAVGTAVATILQGKDWFYALNLGALSLLQAWLSINSLLLLGRGRERLYNVLTTGQGALLALALAGALVGLGYRTVPVFYGASYLAYGLPLLWSLQQLRQLPDAPGSTRLRRRAATRELARHSRGAHFSNIIVFANYRLGYYVVAYLLGTAALGVLSVGVAVAEGLWLIARSTSLIQYVAQVRTAASPAAPDAETGRLAAAALGLTALGAAGLAAVPASWLAWGFGPEFGAARPVLWALAPGIVANAGVNLMSTYFAARASYRINNWTAGLGLLVGLPATLVLVPRLGIVGAALAMSASYSTSAGYLGWQLWRALRTAQMPARIRS